jgi:hypothetical protein
MTAPIIENTYTGDGSTVLFSFTFEYIESTDVEVSVDNVTVATTAYSLANSTTIEFVTAPAVGAAIRIYRNTTVTDPKATFFPGSAIRAQDLNDNFEQILFVTQEADAISERAEAAADQAQIATAAAQAASASATAAANQAQSQVNAAQAAAAAAAADANTATTDAATAISTANSANTTALQASVDAANAGVSAAAAATSAAAAQTSATSAQTSAANAQAQANSASSSAATAASDASNAQTQAQLASTQATAAAGSAATAVSDAATAVTTANNAASDASTALTAANNAVSTANSASSTATTADTNASAAVTTANSAATDATAAVSTANTAATNAATAVTTANTAASDAASALSTANTADTNASAAVTTANTASTNATTALNTANGAATTANTASTDAATAVSTANTAATDASNAVSTANTASTNASTAITNAATAQTTANGAVTTANSASTTASNAASLAQTTANAVADAYLFDVVAAVANIPSSPSDGDAVRVSNSTGIENSSVVQNVPSGFTGDSGINVEIIYSSSASKWNYISYNANDPDDRYGYPPYVDVTRQNTVDAATLSGRPLNSTHLGTFTGSTITDNSTIKTALQELETEVETKADLVGGTVPTSQLPALAITTFLGTVANQTAMLALSGQRGDFAIRSDTSTTFVLTSDGGSNLSDWQELETPTIPIQSVNGQTGTVVLGPSDVGALSTGGGTLTGNVVLQNHLDLGDDNHIRIGAGDDLKIYHDGSNSYVQDSGTGALRIQGSQVQIKGSDSNNTALFKTGAEVELYYNNSQKFETKSDGIGVTGNITLSGTVDGRDVAADGTKLDGIAAGAEVNLPTNLGQSASSTVVTITSSTGTDTTLQAVDGTSAGVMTVAQRNKLAGIETGATADQTAAEIRTLVGSASDSNVFTDALKNKLNAIESNATADQTKADIDALNIDAHDLRGYGWSDAGKNIRGNNIYADAWFRNYDSGEGLYNEATGLHWFSAGTSNYTIKSNTSSTDIKFQTSGSATRGYVYATQSNEIGFLNSSGNWSLRCDNGGNVTATGNVTAYSDIRLKKDIELIPNALDKVLSLRGVTYTDIESDDRRTGVVAQEVQAVLPEAVHEGDEYLSVAYGNLVGVLIESIKELEARVRELEGR